MNCGCCVVGMGKRLSMLAGHTLINIKGPNADSCKVYAVGAEGGNHGGLVIYIFDTVNNQWNPISVSYEDEIVEKAVKTRRQGHASVGVGTSIYIFGGRLKHSMVDHILKFNTLEIQWSFVNGGNCPTISSHTATAVGNKIFLFGGYGEHRLVNDVHIFNTVTKSWSTPKVVGTAPLPLCGHTAVALGEERILVYGGRSDKIENGVWLLEVNTPFVHAQKKFVDGEVVAWSQGKFSDPPKPVVICGPSGVGKGTLITRLMEEFPNDFGFSVSHTTRLPRVKELDGVHYHFTNRSTMELAVKEGKFLETADVHGNMYGTSIAAVEAVSDSGKRCILDIDVQGARSVRKSSMDALFIFVRPPSFEELERRLRGRGTETEEQIKKRLNNAKQELELGLNSSLFDFVLVNDNIETAYEQLKELLGLNITASQNGGRKHCIIEPDARVGHSACLLGKEIVIFGGQTSSGQLSRDLGIIDTSALVGGAPRRTTGLEWRTLETRLINEDDATTHAYDAHRIAQLGNSEIIITRPTFDGKLDTIIMKLEL